MSDAKKIISDLAKDIVQRGLSVPAIFFLESSKYVLLLEVSF